MDEDVKKEGNVYLQHHRFGKRWKSMWCVLFRESSSSISRLELWEIKDGGGGGGGGEKKQRSGRKRTKVIRLSDLVRVSADVRVEACPADSAPFLLETADKVVVLAARADHVAHWTAALCQMAFPVSWEEQQKQKPEEEGMRDNALYSSATDVGSDFQVRVRPTSWSERCGLRGDVVLRASADALHLLDARGATLLSWPYRFLRRFGRDKSRFSVEAGRRCASGEGNFEFDTKEGHALFRAVEAAIGLQRARGTGVRRDPSRKANLPPLPPTPRGHRSPPSAAQVSTYGRVPTRASDGACGPTRQVATGLGDLALDADAAYSRVSSPTYADAAYSRVSLPTYSEATGIPGRRAEHIYDEPRAGGSAASEYDAPEELRGEAWQVMAAPDHLGHGVYTVPKRAEKSAP
nr:docking protein 2-like [Nerophis lumbriciformis]